jgi:hypothetical protein
MRVRKNISRRKNAGRKNEQGIIITLVAVFVLFVLGAMAALSIDVVTLYTARSEAQLAADGAALAGARVLANSGMTSDPNAASDTLASNAETLANTVATQVATGNSVGGRNLAPGEVTVTFNSTASSFVANPHVTVQVQRTDLPTFFARVWGRTQVTVGASATAEAYNPSAANSAVGTGGGGPPVAPVCVKPWLLPNLDPTGSGNQIFWPSGTIYDPNLLGKSWPGGTNTNGLYARCGDCSTGVVGPTLPAPLPGAYYPGAIDAPAPDFPAPVASACPNCSNGFNQYQLAVAGCVQQPISCGATPNINIDTNPYVPNNPAGRDADTVQAAECLIHYNGAAGDADSIDTSAPPSPPFQFLAGSQNPIAGAINQPVLVSDSLVTIPVISTATLPLTNPATVIGFLQVFLNPASTTLPITGPANPNEIPATIINMAGCGTSVTGSPILGNGASPVAVRLISPP